MKTLEEEKACNVAEVARAAEPIGDTFTGRHHALLRNWGVPAI